MIIIKIQGGLDQDIPEFWSMFQTLQKKTYTLYENSFTSVENQKKSK